MTKFKWNTRKKKDLKLSEQHVGQHHVIHQKQNCLVFHGADGNLIQNHGSVVGKEILFQIDMIRLQK